MLRLSVVFENRVATTYLTQVVLCLLQGLMRLQKLFVNSHDLTRRSSSGLPLPRISRKHLMPAWRPADVPQRPFNPTDSTTTSSVGTSQGRTTSKGEHTQIFQPEEPCDPFPVAILPPALSLLLIHFSYCLSSNRVCQVRVWFQGLVIRWRPHKSIQDCGKFFVQIRKVLEMLPVLAAVR